jgi:ribonucleotide reductase alpha subunit
MYNRRVLAGEFTIVNKHLLRELTAAGLWTDSVRNRIIADGGSVQNVHEIPKETRDVYKTVWEIPQRSVLDMAADRGPYICQSQSMNVHIAEPSAKKLTSMHFYAWKKGLKTGMYYLRTRPKADAIQFTVNQEQLVADRAKSEVLRDKENVPKGTAVKVAPAGKAIGGLQTVDDEDECLNCGA